MTDQAQGGQDAGQQNQQDAGQQNQQDAGQQNQQDAGQQNQQNQQGAGQQSQQISPEQLQAQLAAMTPAQRAQFAQQVQAQRAAQGPINYDLSGAGLDDGMTAAFVQYARANGIPPETAAAQAQQLSNFAATVQARQYAAARAEGERALRADPEFGGDGYDKTLSDAKAAVQSLGGDELMRELDASGLGNSPALIKALAKLTRSGQIRGSFVSGGPNRSGGEKSVADLFYSH